MATSQTLVGVNVGPTKNFSATVVWTGTNSPVGTIKIQVSNASTNGSDGADWIDYTGITLGTQPAGSAGSFGVEIVDVGYQYVRFVYTASSGGTGAFLTVTVFGKG
jgi:hypothetical protein